MILIRLVAREMSEFQDCWIQGRFVRGRKFHQLDKKNY